MPSAELIGLQAPKKAHRSLVFALAVACRQIESAGLIGAASHSSFGGASSHEPLSIFRHRRALEEGVSALEDGAAAAAFGSGMAAAMGLLGALAPGDHVLAHVDAYYGTSRLLRDLFLRWKLEADFADMSDLPAVKKALRPNTKLVWMETPSNPLLKIVDL